MASLKASCGCRWTGQLFKRLLKHPALRRCISSSSICKESSSAAASSGGEVSSCLCKLPHRSLVSVKGRDSHTLLQGLVTADATMLSQQHNAMYSMLLNAQGRVLYDVILHHQGEGQVQIECDTQVSRNIVTHLKRYALRSDVAIDVDASCDVWVAYPGRPDHTPRNVAAFHPDPRTSSLGVRILAPVSTSSHEMGLDLQPTTPDDYLRHRLQMGVAEGPGEVPTGNCTPLEYNLDYLNGVSFVKGCYLGQELTARTHHTGVIRKRVVPVTSHDKLEGEVKGGKLVSESGKNVGRLICLLDGVGLALLRVKEIGVRLSLQSEESGGVEVAVVAHRPQWWPDNDSTTD